MIYSPIMCGPVYDLGRSRFTYTNMPGCREYSEHWEGVFGGRNLHDLERPVHRILGERQP